MNPIANDLVSRTVTRRGFVRAAGVTAAGLALSGGVRGADLLQKAGRMIERKSKATISPVGLNHGDTLRFVLRDGRAWEMPTAQNIDVFVDRLERAGLLVFEPRVESHVYGDDARTVPERTAQSRMLRAVGLSRRTLARAGSR